MQITGRPAFTATTSDIISIGGHLRRVLHVEAGEAYGEQFVTLLIDGVGFRTYPARRPVGLLHVSYYA